MVTLRRGKDATPMTTGRYGTAKQQVNEQGSFTTSIKKTKKLVKLLDHVMMV